MGYLWKTIIYVNIEVILLYKKIITVKMKNKNNLEMYFYAHHYSYCTFILFLNYKNIHKLL